MSHTTEIKIKGVEGEEGVRDLDALSSAAGSLGGTFLRGRTEFVTYGGKAACDHAIRFADCTYEVGVVREGETHRLKFDSWSSGGLGRKLGGRNAPHLVRAYSEHRNANIGRDAVLAAAAGLGYSAEVAEVSPGVRKVVVHC